MELLFQAVAQLDKLIDRAKMGEDKRVLLGLIQAQDCVLEQLWPSLSQADDDDDDDDDVGIHGEPDPDHAPTHDTRTKVKVS
jgi:hypothetical protein